MEQWILVENQTYEEIGRRLGVTGAAIKKAAKRLGIELPVRRYMLEKYNYKCSKCGWGEVNPYTNLVPLQIHHVDGNSTNNKEENLEVLCPNCHSLTENFGSRNTNAPEGKSAYYCKGSSSSAE